MIIFLKASWHSFIIKIPPVAHTFINGLELSPVSYTELGGRILNIEYPYEDSQISYSVISMGTMEGYMIPEFVQSDSLYQQDLIIGWVDYFSIKKEFTVFIILHIIKQLMNFLTSPKICFNHKYLCLCAWVGGGCFKFPKDRVGE